MKREDTPMWSDPEEPSYVRELLDAGRGAPIEYDAAKGLAAHLAHVKAGTPLPHWAQAGASAGSMSTAALMGWIALPVVAASVVAGLYFGTQPSAAVTSAPSPVVVVPQVEQASAPAVEVAPIEEAAPAGALVPKSVARAATARKATRLVRKSDERSIATSAKVGSEPKAKAMGTSTPTPRVSTSATGLAGRTTQRDTDTLAESATAPTPARESQRTVEEQSEQAAEPALAVRPQVDESRLEREMQMLAVAQRVLSQDPQRALRMAEQGNREFPKSMFSAERQQVALLAMVKLGRIDEARRIGQPFLAKYPNAPWSARLRRALATGRVE